MTSSARQQHDVLIGPKTGIQREKHSFNQIDLQGVTIDTNSHVTKICRKASRQLNALKRLCFYISLDTR